ncbi:trypsin-like peptidase domain-containing protein [Catellatospora sp. NPDC049609]|uniref:S1C family serine protease n=1 Tax=Catellatospora sp. NPDC049609 TaxID=3155505 RepID=UPI00343FF720
MPGRFRIVDTAPAVPPAPPPTTTPGTGTDGGAPGPRARVPHRVLIAALAAAVLALTAVVAFQWGSSSSSQAPAAAPAPSPSAEQPLTVGEIYQTLAPSVVFVKSTGKSGTATGTGVVANADGSVLTALHVVRGASAIEISFADGTTTKATISGQDPKQDIAVLTPAQLPSVLVPAVLGGGAAIGDPVVAIGNPLGLVQSTTSGVVSGLDRSIVAKEAGELDGLIQFDAAVNPGSSGGPLVNERGQTIGIVVALANPTQDGTFIGVGFAVPIGAALGADGPRPQL